VAQQLQLVELQLAVHAPQPLWSQYCSRQPAVDSVQPTGTRMVELLWERLLE
jgi:hypothetical protein